MSLNNYQLTTIIIGSSICLLTLICIALTKNYKITNTFTKDKIFYLKKYALITFLLLINVGCCIMTYYTKNLNIIMYVIIFLKLKDLIMAVIFIINKCIKSFSKYCCKSNKNKINHFINKKNNIIAMVPSYSESVEAVTETVKSLINNDLKGNNLVICVISDGTNNYDTIINEKNIITKEYEYQTWLGNVLNISISYGTYNNINIIIIHKNQNHGKKDSIIMFNDIFNIERNNIPDMNKTYKSNILNDMDTIFNINKFEYMFSTDADTIIDTNSFECLINSIEDRGAIASCGIINVNRNYGNAFWNNFQNFQYLYGQFLRRSVEDLFGQVTCLPGCMTMFKIHNESKVAMDMYSSIPKQSNIIKSSIQYIGTDRRLTGNLIYSNENAKIVLNTECNAYTIPPSNLTSYINQRKRWYQNTYFNSLMNIISPNVIFLNRIFNILDFLKLSLVYFRLFNTIYFIYLLSISDKNNDIMRFIPFIIILSIPTLCFFIYSLFNKHLRNIYLSLLITFIYNKVMILLTNVIIFTAMLIHIGSSKWHKNNNDLDEVVVVIDTNYNECVTPLSHSL